MVGNYRVTTVAQVKIPREKRLLSNHLDGLINNQNLHLVLTKWATYQLRYYSNCLSLLSLQRPVTVFASRLSRLSHRKPGTRRPSHFLACLKMEHYETYFTSYDFHMKKISCDSRLYTFDTLNSLRLRYINCTSKLSTLIPSRPISNAPCANFMIQLWVSKCAQPVRIPFRIEQD